MNASRSVTSAVLAWTWFYTRGLNEAVRDARRDEIASDLFEQRAAEGDGRAVAASMALRWALGVPADLAWRIEESGARTAPGRMAAAVLARGEAAGRRASRRGLPGLTMVLAALYGLGGALVIITLPVNNNPERGGLAVFGAWLIVAGALIAWGARLVAGRPWAGMLAVFAGAAPLAILLVVTVIVPVATLVVLSHTVARARRVWRDRRHAGFAAPFPDLPSHP